MIDPLIAILQKLIDLLKSHADTRQKTLDVIVTPLYDNLKFVHEDYLHLFQTCIQAIKNDTDLSQIADRLLSDRLQQEALRRSIAAFANSFACDRRLRKYADFFNSVTNYLYDSTLILKASRSELLMIELGKAVDNARKRKTKRISRRRNRDNLILIIEYILSDIRKGWNVVSKEYAKLLARRTC